MITTGPSKPLGIKCFSGFALCMQEKRKTNEGKKVAKLIFISARCTKY
jgi:hypothetical protein